MGEMRMIIDFHAHLMSPNIIAQPYWDNWVKLSSRLSRKPEEEVRKRVPEFWDETGEMLISDMDDAGIDYTVISVADFGLAKGIGEPPWDILEINSTTALIFLVDRTNGIRYDSLE